MVIQGFTVHKPTPLTLNVVFACFDRGSSLVQFQQLSSPCRTSLLFLPAAADPLGRQDNASERQSVKAVHRCGRGACKTRAWGGFWGADGGRMDFP